MQQFTWGKFSLRLLFAALLVFCTWNPSGFSFVHWASTAPIFTPEKAIVGLALLIGWIIFVRATMRSLGPVGIGLFAAIFACIIWLLFDKGWLSGDNLSVMTWLVLCATSVMLAVGISWSHVRRRLSGQVDTDDIDI